MASGFTNRGKFKLLDWVFRGTALPTNFYVALCTSAATPTADTNTFSELTEIAAGNGYTAGGISLTKNSTDFDTLTEDDSGDLGKVLIKDLVWTASGGTLPASGNGARWAILTDDNATQGSRLVIAWFDLTSDRSVSSGQPLTLQDCELRLT
jgi:hypothetical protein